jgi:transglutaminase-like putative cysteine protease
MALTRWIHRPSETNSPSPSMLYQGSVLSLAILMVFALTRPLADFWRLPASHTSLLLYASLGALFGWLCWRSGRLALLIVALGMGASAGAGRYEPAWADYFTLLWKQASELWVNLLSLHLDTTFGLELGILFIMAISVGAALLIVTEAMSKGRTFWSIALGSVVFGMKWAWFYERGISWFFLYITLAFTAWVTIQAGRRDALWRGTGRQSSYGSQILSPIAAVLVISLLATFLPSNLAPINVGVLGEKMQEQFPFLQRFRGAGVSTADGRFSLRTTGFAPVLGALGGPVRPNHAEALQLSLDFPLSETAYLRGTTYKTYSANTWLPGSVEYREPPKDGVMTSTYSPDILSSEFSYRITPTGFGGYTLFHMLEPVQVEGLKTAYQFDNDAALVADRAPMNASTYTVRSRVPTYSAQQIRLRSTTDPEETYLPYLQLPPNLPSRVKQFTTALTQRADHPYDKAIAIETYLRSGRYDLNAPSAPAGRDFVDYFLFTLKSGYCTYYATAMAVMLRTIGVPTRFVEGFAVPSSQQPLKESSGNRYAIPNSLAHAWVEAYFPGYGWVTFDPTPRSDLPLIDRSTPLPQTSPSSPSDSTPSTDLPEGLSPEEFAEGEAFGPEGTSPLAEQPSGWRWVWWSLLVGALLTLFLFARLRRTFALTGSDQRVLVQQIWTETASLLDRFNFGPKPHQTAEEWAHALGQSWPSMAEPLLLTARAYTTARYGSEEHALPPDAGQRARELLKEFHGALRHRYGWRTYWWRRIS